FGAVGRQQSQPVLVELPSLRKTPHRDGRRRLSLGEHRDPPGLKRAETMPSGRRVGCNQSCLGRSKGREPLSARGRKESSVSKESHQAFLLLKFGFTVAPIIAGLDKFLGLLTNWDKYLAPSVSGALGIAPHTFMMAVGVIEIVAGIV